MSRLRIDRDTGRRRRWVPWAVLVVLAAAGAAVYPNARAYVAERRAPEVETARVTQVVTTPGGSTALPVLVATHVALGRRATKRPYPQRTRSVDVAATLHAVTFSEDRGSR